jgi:hypothetical protein
VAPTQAQADAIRDQWLTKVMRPATLPPVGASATLEYVKMARIGTDGHYIDDKPVISNQAPAGSAGSGVSAHPPQIALAVTLLGPNPRGAAGKGRLYLPNPAFAVAGDGRISAAQAEAVANHIAGFINQVNTIMTGAVHIVGPATATGRAGASQPVTGIRVGRVLDTMRSRRSSMPEEPVAATVAITTP